MSRRSDSVAERFTRQLLPGVGRFDEKQWTILKLVAGACALYELSARGSGWDIRHWQWPFDALSRGDHFEGSEPWTVLLREAVNLGTTYINDPNRG
jgi:hypothetical protein